MEEYIGKVKLILDYYKGEDAYSDGEIEDEILDIVKNCEGGDYGSIIKERQKWPILYHLSDLRGNIVKSMPIESTDEILEIGAGCGAVTAALCGMGKKLDCVDLSKKRSMINAYRNKNAENVSIYVGNFQDIEPELPKYDVITLIGVLEYAASYIKAEKPYEAFLRIAKKHLKPGGRIYLAIENRFGMKYWAGCQEDHLGGLFRGIDGYRPEDGVQTFGRKELEGIFKAAGFDNTNFYYPYPDYKFPMSVYSDSYLPKKGWLVNNNMNFDRSKVYLFEESRVYDQIIDEGNYAFFANSFLVEAAEALNEKNGTSEDSLLEKDRTHGNSSAEKERTSVNLSAEINRTFENPSIEEGLSEDTSYREFIKNAKLIYSKFSGERNPEYAIKTDIYQGETGKFIIKSPLKPEGEEHVRKIADNYDRLKKMFEGSKIKVQPVVCLGNNIRGSDGLSDNNKCALEDKFGKNFTACKFPFIEGEIFENRLNSLIEKNEMETAYAEIKAYFDLLKEKAGNKKFKLENDFSGRQQGTEIGASNLQADMKIGNSDSNSQADTKAETRNFRADFISVFGNETFPEDTVCGEISNIDYCFGNIIIAEDGWYLIDYEWCSDFPIPLDFLLFRAIHYFVHAGTWGSRLLADNIFGRFGFDDEKRAKYERMETRFHRFISGRKIGIGELKQTMLEKTWNIHEMYRECDEADVHKPLQIYYDYGDGFFHENSYLKMPKIENGVISIEVTDIPQEAERVRIDVRKRPCMLFVKSFTDEKGRDMMPMSEINGSRIGEKSFACPAIDPWIVLRHGDAKALRLEFSVEADFLSQYQGETMDPWKDYLESENRISEERKERQRLEERIRQLENEISAEKEKAELYRAHCEARTRSLSEELEQKRELVNIMENSTSWKMTKPMREAVRKIKSIKG